MEGDCVMMFKILCDMGVLTLWITWHILESLKVNNRAVDP